MTSKEKAAKAKKLAESKLNEAWVMHEMFVLFNWNPLFDENFWKWIHSYNDNNNNTIMFFFIFAADPRQVLHCSSAIIHNLGLPTQYY